MAGQLVVAKARTLEVEIVEYGVFNAGVYYVASERLFPDTFGNPHSSGFDTQSILEPIVVGANLANPVVRRDHGQNGLEEGPRDDLDPSFGGQCSKTVNVLRLVAVEPFHQRTAGVQGDPERLESLENVEKRPVAVVECLLEDVVEVSNGLVIVQCQYESYVIWHVFGKFSSGVKKCDQGGRAS